MHPWQCACTCLDDARASSALLPAYANKSDAGVQGQCLLTEAPAAAAPAQLTDLHIALAPEPNQAPAAAGANGCGPPAAH